MWQFDPKTSRPYWVDDHGEVVHGQEEDGAKSGQRAGSDSRPSLQEAARPERDGPWEEVGPGRYRYRPMIGNYGSGGSERAQIPEKKSEPPKPDYLKPIRVVVPGELTGPTDFAGPIVFADGAWQLLPKSDDHKKYFPELGAQEAAVDIPSALLARTDRHGALIAPCIRSKALGRSVRVGVYVPPGYDPNGTERYPVLVMLPGRGNPLHVWTSAGDVVAKLDKLMAGDAQKMIVVIPENSNSYYFDYSKLEDPHGNGKDDHEGLIVEDLIGFATTKLKGDAQQLSVLGISRGAFGALSLAARHPGLFKSVSGHSGLYEIPDKEPSRKALYMASGKDEDGGGPAVSYASVSPLPLAKAGAFDRNAPRMFIDVAYEDPYMKGFTLDFARALEARGVAFRFQVPEHPKQQMLHNWEAWAQLLPRWVAFHQETFGRPGPVVESVAYRDRAKEDLAKKEEKPGFLRSFFRSLGW